MSGKYTWKLIITVIVVAWSVMNLLPLRNTEFQQFVQERANGSTKWDDTYKKAKERFDAGRAKTFYIALRDQAAEDNVDLAQFFPFIKLEPTLTDTRRRNAIVLEGLMKRSRGKIQFGLDLRGGVAFTLEVDRPADAPTAAADAARKNELAEAIKIISERVDSLGVTEPVIRPVGNNRIVVQLAGVSTKDNPEVVDVLKKPAKLEFKLVDSRHRPETTAPEDVPPGYREMLYEDEQQGRVTSERLFIKKVPEMTGKMVERAGVSLDQFGKPYIVLKFTSDGAEKFADVTRQIYQDAGGPNGRLAIVLDGKVQSAPRVLQAITGGTASITGKFSDRDAQDLATVLNNPLDLPLRIVETSEIGPTLAADAVSSGWKASIIGVSATAVVMITVYTLGGFLAVIAMMLNVLIILGVMCSNLVGATLSMPGIAGIVLTIGMAVDSNILIFERMREEMVLGKNLRASLEAGFEKAFSAIFDANITTLITAAIMWWLGTGPVKGFGVTLTIGIFSTMFAALIISRLLLEFVVYTGGVGHFKFVSVVPKTSIDFMKYARAAFLVSWTIVLIGVVTVAVKGRSIYGIDFTGGDQVSLTMNRHLDLGQIRAAANGAGVTDYAAQYQKALGGTAESLNIETPEGQGQNVVKKLQELYPDAAVTVQGLSAIGASVSSEIQWNAFKAIGLSLLGILLYVAFRFEIGYSVGAVAATIHDLLMTVGIFVLFDRQFNAAMVGAILLIAGYSINDTIVVFDRIREELKLNPNARLRDLINHSLNATLSRTFLTGGTTLVTALSLFIFAGGEVNDIAFTLIIGILTGTFSSVFIASPIFYWWHKGDRKHVEASHDIAPKYEWSASSRAAE